MLSKLSNTLRTYAKGWTIFVLFLLDAAFMGFILPMVQGLIQADSGGAGPIDLLFVYTPAKAYQMVAAYGEYGRSFYRNVELSLDLLYPIVYTLFFSLLVTWLFQRGFAADSKLQRLNVVPLGAWLFDLLENIGIVAMLSIFPSAPALLGWLTAIFTLIKWLFAGASMVLVLTGLLAAIRHGFRRQAAATA